jgi:photosystem II stability/assembly factor-like uncharacterized protein
VKNKPKIWHGFSAFILALYLIFNSFPVHSQWTWQNPLPTGAVYYRGCDFIDSSRGWIVGDWGCIIRTTDGGLTWEVQHSGVTADLYAVFFLDENYGWAVGSYGTIIHTINGGQSWQLQKQYYDPYVYITSVYFTDSLNGWTDGVDGSGQFFRTTNGGEDWIAEYIPGVSSTWELSSIFFTDSLFFWVETGNHKLSHTEDGGITWTPHESPINFGEIFFVNHDTGWVTLNSMIYRTNDRAATWFEQDHPNQGPSIYDLYFADLSHGWAAGGSGLLLRTGDGGETWENTETDVVFMNVEFYGIFNGWAVGGLFGQLYHTIDGGVSWSQERKGTDGFITDIGFGDEAFGLAIYYTMSGEHAVAETYDGGNTWTLRVLDADTTWWYALDLVDENNGWICGENGTILHTGNRGISWEIQRENHPIERLTEIQFLNSLEGFAAGIDTSYENLFLVKTSDGGITWSTYVDSFDGYISGMWFTDSSNGYIVAKNFNMSQAVILITRNGGESWEMMDLPLSTFEYPTSVQFVSPEVGFIAANNYILKTTDQGATWDKTHISGLVPGSVWFTDSLNGWCVGRNAYHGVAYRTTDGGENWEYIVPETENELLDVYFTSPENGWVCGNGGNILKWEQNNPVSIKEDSFSSPELKLIVNPNPANSMINVKLSQLIDQDANFRIYSISGQLQKSVTYRKSGTDINSFTIPVNDLNSGIYLFQLISGKESASGKIVILH